MTGLGPRAHAANRLDLGGATKSVCSRTGRISPSFSIFREKLLELYAGEVSFSDTQFGKLLDYLEGAGLYDSSLIVLLSDHGEEFDDHGWWRHGKTLYGEQLNVPLIIKWPGGFAAGKRVSKVAQHIDLVPTLLD